jgi:hypothetical protein
MNVTLRKAHALSKALLEQTKKLPLNRTVTISVYEPDDPDSVVEAAGEVLLANVDIGRRLIEASTAIRLQIGIANKSAGVDALLSEKAKLDTVEKLLGKVVGGSDSDYGFAQATDPLVARAKLEAIITRNNATGERFNSLTEELVVKVATGDVVQGLADELATIRRRKTEIADELLTKNSSTTVALDAATVELLKTYKLI